MPIADSPIIAFCAVAYMVICLGIGIWAMRRTKSAADFFVAGKSLPLVVTVIAGVSSIVSGLRIRGRAGACFRVRDELAVDDAGERFYGGQIVAGGRQAACA